MPTGVVVLQDAPSKRVANLTMTLAVVDDISTGRAAVRLWLAAKNPYGVPANPAPDVVIGAVRVRVRSMRANGRLMLLGISEHEASNAAASHVVAAQMDPHLSHGTGQT